MVHECLIEELEKTVVESCLVWIVSKRIELSCPHVGCGIHEAPFRDRAIGLAEHLGLPLGETPDPFSGLSQILESCVAQRVGAVQLEIEELLPVKLLVAHRKRKHWNPICPHGSAFSSRGRKGVT